MAPLNRCKGTFIGDAEGLVDCLIAACEKKPVLLHSPDKLPLRELTPYFSSEDAQALDVVHRSAQQTCRKALNVPTNRPQQHQVKRKISATTSRSTSPQAVQVAKAVRKQVTSPNASPTMTVERRTKSGDGASAVKGPTTSASAGGRAAHSSKPMEYACPAMLSSPKPVDIPLPSASLMMRASLLCRAAA